MDVTRSTYGMTGAYILVTKRGSHGRVWDDNIKIGLKSRVWLCGLDSSFPRCLVADCCEQGNGSLCSI